MIEDLLHDVTGALRWLKRDPGFAIAATVVLALGIGANAAIYSVVHAVLLRPLPYNGSGRLVRLVENAAARPNSAGPPRQIHPLAVGDLAALRARAKTLAHVGVYLPWTRIFSTGDERARATGVSLSPDILPMLDARPLIGRPFNASDARAGVEDVVLLSQRVWQRVFDGRADVLGQNVSLDGKTHVVIGVLPDSFTFPDPQTEFWTPFVPATTGPAAQQRLPLLASLQEGVSQATAAGEVTALLADLRGVPPAGTPALPAGVPRFALLGVEETLVAPVRPALLVLAVAVGVVLLIACLNVAMLVLAKTAARRRDLAVRRALGAARGRLIRQLLTESLTLALLGGVGGLAIAYGGIRLLKTLSAPALGLNLGPTVSIPRLDEIGIDPSVIGFTAAVSILAGVVSGLLPALRDSRTDAMLALREGGNAAASGFGLMRGHRLQGSLIIIEIALATTLFIGGTLLIRSFVQLSQVNPGYDPANVLTFSVTLPESRADEQLRAFAEALAARLRSAPNVRGAGYAESLPLVAQGRVATLSTTPELPNAGPGTDGSQTDMVDARLVSRDFLSTMGMQVVAGRGFREADAPGSQPVILINRTLARARFQDRSPIGEKIYVLGNVTFDPRKLKPDAGAPQPWEIVGIVDDVRQSGFDQEPGPQLFVDIRQLPGPTGPPGTGLFFTARVDGAPGTLAREIRGLVRQLDAGAVIEHMAPMEQLVSSVLARPRLYAAILGLFAGIAVILASLGIYGIVAYAVARRTREIGIRMALGATRSSVVRMILGQTAVLTVAGIALGLTGAALLTRYLEGLLFGLTPLDAGTFVLVALLFAAMATLAGFIPARRATQVDPLRAVRAE